MKWTKGAEKVLMEYSEDLRVRAKRIMETEARHEGRSTITEKEMREAKDGFLALAFDKGEGHTDIAVVRCERISEDCPGDRCLKAFAERMIRFEPYGPDARLVAFFTCGGCPGRRIPRLAKQLKEKGVKTIHLSTCMISTHYPICLSLGNIRRVLVEQGFQVVDGTHRPVKGRAATKAHERTRTE